MRKLLLAGVVAFIASISVLLVAEERPDEAVFWKIRQEGTANSQILRTLHMLTDVHGPRLTGSPNLKAAGDWAIQQMQAWGLKNGHLDPWNFGYPGWTNERLAAYIVSPVKDTLVGEALAWTPGTNGPVKGAAVQVTLPRQPTREELAAHLDTLKDAVKGKMVLVNPPQQVRVTFNPAPLRREDGDVISQMTATPAPAGRGGGPPAPAEQGQPGTPQRRPLTANQLEEQLNAFLAANGVLVRITDAGRDHGQIRAFNNRTFDETKAPPVVVMRNEDYGRIWRLLDDKRPVELEFDIVNRTYPEGRTSYNFIAEIPGSDKADEDRDAGRPPRLVACRDRRDRQRHWLFRDDGSGADSGGHRRQAAANDPRRALERGRTGPARLAGVRPRALRQLRGAQAGVREARRRTSTSTAGRDARGG